jgi:hypothetical protein
MIDDLDTLADAIRTTNDLRDVCAAISVAARMMVDKLDDHERRLMRLLGATAKEE